MFATKNWVINLLKKIRRRDHAVQTYYTTYGDAGTVTFDEDIQFAFVAYNGSRYSYFIENLNNPDGNLSTYVRRYSGSDTTYSVLTGHHDCLKIDGNKVTWKPVSSNYTGNYIMYTIPKSIELKKEKVTITSNTTPTTINLDVMPRMVFVEKPIPGDNKIGSICYFYVKKDFTTYLPTHQYMYYCGWRDSQTQVAINDGGYPYFNINQKTLTLMAPGTNAGYQGEYYIYYC